MGQLFYFSETAQFQNQFVNGKEEKMRIPRPPLVYLFLFPLLFCLTCSKEKPLTTSQLVDKLVQESDAVESYRVETKTSMRMGGQDVTTTGKIAYKKPGLLHMTTSTNMMGGMTHETFKTKDVAWTYIPLMKIATKMEMPKFEGAMSSHNSGMGAPVMMLRDFPKEAVTSHEKKLVDGNEVYELKVSLDNPHGETNTGKSFGMMPAKMDFLINADTGMPHKVTMYAKDDTPIMEMSYLNYQINVPIPDSEFEFTPPEGAQIMDMTKAAKGMMSHMHGGSAPFQQEPKEQPADGAD